MPEVLRRHAGGIAGLRALLAEHTEEIEADLQIHCNGVDLRDLYRPGRRLTWRRLGSLVRNLPPESATKTAMRNKMGDGEAKSAAEAADPSEGRWSQTEMLLALLVDSVRNLQYALIRVNGGKGKPPEPLPRPGVRPKGRRARKPLSLEKAEFLYRWINGPDA